jgi:hypothetical protein
MGGDLSPKSRVGRASIDPPLAVMPSRNLKVGLGGTGGRKGG